MSGSRSASPDDASAGESGPGRAVRRLAARLLTRRPSPSVDLYFLNACADLVGPHGPVRRVAPTVFESPTARLVIRHDVGAPPPRSGRRLVYLLDDAIFAGRGDRSLPAWHRLKLHAAECDAARRLLPRLDALVVSAPGVAEALPAGLLRRQAEIAALDPYWPDPYAPLDHFGTAGPTIAAFLGAGTHRASLPFIAETISRAMRTAPDLRLAISGNHRGRIRLPPDRLSVIEETVWTGYRRAARRLRAHVALYPLPPTRHAAARSANKLIEHALIGAAPLYVEDWGPGRAAAAEGAGLALPRDPEIWAAALSALAEDRARARRLAERAQALARRLSRPDPQRALWRRLLELP